MVAFTATEETVEITSNNIPSREEQIALLGRLLAEGKREFLSSNYSPAADKLGDAANLSVELYGELAPENYEAQLWYGRSMLELAQMQDEVLDHAVSEQTKDNHVDQSEDSMDAAKEQNNDLEEHTTNSETMKVEGVLGSSNNESPEGSDDEEEEDEEELSNIQLAWEVLESARAICEKQESCKDWDLKRAEVLFHLSDVSLINNDFDRAIDDLTIILEIQSKHLEIGDRGFAQTYVQLARAHKAKDDYENAANYYKLSKKSLIDTINVLKSTSEGEVDSQINDLQAIISDLDLKIEDAEESHKQVEKHMNQLRHQLGIGSNVSKTLIEKTATPATDITNMVRKPLKRSAEADSDSAKKAKGDEANLESTASPRNS